MARHPYELEGAYFCFTMIITPFICIYFGSRYLSYVEDEEVAEALSYVLTEGEVYGGIGGLIVLQITSFLMFLFLIEDKYRSTFTSFRTGSQHVVGTFENASNERVKIGVMNNHRSLWKVIEGDVRRWLNENLPAWLSEQPEWFDATVRRMVFDDIWWTTQKC